MEVLKSLSGQTNLLVVVKEYLQKIYGCAWPTGRNFVKTPGWKKAIVRFERVEEGEGEDAMDVVEGAEKV